MIKARVLHVDRKKILLNTGIKLAKIATSDITPECILEQRGSDDPAEPPRSPGEVRPGDTVQVFLEHEETPEGDMLVSGQQAAVKRRVRAVWKELQDRLHDGQPVKGRVLNSLSGGYAVGVAGLVCFLPNRATTPATARRIGELQDFKVVQMNPARNNVVLTDWRVVKGARALYRPFGGGQQQQQHQQYRQQKQQYGQGQGQGQGGGGWKQKNKERVVLKEAEAMQEELKE